MNNSKYLLESARKIGREVSGPMWIPFCEWLRELADRLQVDRVVFLARDGQLLHRLAKAMGFEQPLSYFLGGSRASWYPCIPHLLGQRIYFRRIRSDFENIKSASMVFGTTVLKVAEELGIPTDQPISNKEAFDISAALSTPSNLNNLEQESRDARCRMLKYFAQSTGSCSGEKVLLVDLGWNGSFHDNFRPVAESQLNLETISAYYGLNVNSDSSTKFSFRYGPSLFPHWMSQFPCLLEMLSPADHGSVLGYQDHPDGSVVPLLARRPVANPRVVHALHDGCFEYFHRRSCPTTSLRNFVENPSQEAIDVFQTFHFQPTFEPDNEEPFISSPSRRNCAYLSLGFRRNLNRWHWPQATLVQSGLRWMKVGLTVRFQISHVLQTILETFRPFLQDLTRLMVGKVRFLFFNTTPVDFCSIDVFDTLLVRKCGSYKNLLRLLEGRTRVAGLASRRLRAEYEVAKAHRFRVTRLEEIYRFLENEDPQLDWDYVMRTELVLEEENLKPASQSTRLLSKARKQYRQILFVSDMHMPTDWIRKILQTFGLIESTDFLYVSESSGATKESRVLYRILKENHEGHGLHIGDNFFVDILGASSEGFETRWRPASVTRSFLNNSQRLLSRTKRATRTLFHGHH